MTGQNSPGPNDDRPLTHEIERLRAENAELQKKAEGLQWWSRRDYENELERLTQLCEDLRADRRCVARDMQAEIDRLQTIATATVNIEGVRAEVEYLRTALKEVERLLAVQGLPGVVAKVAALKTAQAALA